MELYLNIALLAVLILICVLWKFASVDVILAFNRQFIVYLF